LTRFHDLSDDVLLMICRYLSPIHVIKAFLDCDDRMFSCISEYRHYMNLSACSYTDLRYFLKLLADKQLRPSELILNNAKIPTQIRIFIAYMSNIDVRFVQHLSLLECTESDFDQIDSVKEKFHSLQSLTITESIFYSSKEPIASSTICKLRDLIFDNSFDLLTELELSTIDGIVLDKALHANRRLQRMNISLDKIDDLLVLFDGLVPNLIALDVTLCASHTSKRSPIPRDWPRRYMHHLIEFQLITNETVEFTFDQLKGIVMPLIKVQKLTLDIKQWNSNNQQFIEGDQIDALIGQVMTQLRDFHCFIQTSNGIDLPVINSNESIVYF
jgi:hypothetical protein